MEHFRIAFTVVPFINFARAFLADKCRQKRSEVRFRLQRTRIAARRAFAAAADQKWL